MVFNKFIESIEIPSDSIDVYSQLKVILKKEFNIEISLQKFISFNSKNEVLRMVSDKKDKACSFCCRNSREKIKFFKHPNSHHYHTVFIKDSYIDRDDGLMFVFGETDVEGYTDGAFIQINYCPKCGSKINNSLFKDK